MTVRMLTAVIVIVAGVAEVKAEPIRLIPATDPDGRVFSRNENDVWGEGRGVVFTAVRPVVLSSVSLFHDLTGLDLVYQVAAVGHSEGQVTDGQIIVRAGARTITTSGLEFIPFAFEPLRLVTGNSYHIQFSFNGNGNQNFFHNNCESFDPNNVNTCIGGQVPYSVGPFANVDGTQGGNTGNFVQPAVVVEVAEAAPIPEPGTILLLSAGAAAAGAKRLRRRPPHACPK